MMYNYDFFNDLVIFENNNVCLEIKDKVLFKSLVITKHNILLFSCINKNNVLNTRGMSRPLEYELFLKIPLKELEYSIENNNTYLKKEDIIIYDIDISQII